MPEDEIIKDYKRPFSVYWNVPTVQCKSKKVLFENLYEKYGIIQNDGDNFRGEKITILYEPGTFPAILKNETSGKYRFRNGGVPQEGNLDEHLKAFKEDVKEIVPDPNFDGIGIIDFESWRPIFRQNFGTLVPYKDVSYEIERKLHWWWPKSWINGEAEKRFETAARQFMQTTLSIAKQMRPRASWGYYGFPHCFNMAAPSLKENCSPQVLAENDLLYWMWSESSALYPSVYSTRNLTTSQLGSLVRGRVREAIRVRRYSSPVLPYYWFRYREGGYMKEKDVDIVLKSFYNSNASGFIIWGSSNDVNTLEKCKNLHSYVETILGPAISKYVKKINIANDVIIETPPELTVENEAVTTVVSNQTNTVETENNTSTSKVVIDPELVFIPPLNYTQDISKNVEEELVKKGYNKSDEITDIKTLNDSTVVDMIFDALMKSDKNNANNEKTQTERGVEIETDITSINNNLEITEAPVIKDLDTLNSLITKDPMGFIEKLADEEKKIGFLDDPLTTKEPLNDKEVVGPVTKSSFDRNLHLKENQVLSETDNLFNGDITMNMENIDSTTSTNKFSEQNQNKIEDNTVPIANDDMFIDIFDALLNGNYKLDDENSNKYIESEQNEFTTLKTDVEYTKQDDLRNKNDLENITTDEYMANFDENFTKIFALTEENSQRVFPETKPTTEINLSDTTEYDPQLTLSAENVFSDKTDLIERFDDLFLSITNTTDLDVGSSTQFDNTVFDNNEDNLIILAVNLTNRSISDNYLKTSEQTTESDASTLSDSVVLESDEFILNNNKQQSFSENESFTTDAATDQVVTYIYYP